MKNIIYLIFIANLLTLPYLTAQIETISLDDSHTASKTPPLSISDVGSVISVTNVNIPNSSYPEINFPTTNYQIVNLEPKILNLKLNDFNFKPQTSNLSLNDSIFNFKTSNLKLKTSNALNFNRIGFFQSADNFDKKRFFGFMGASATAYGGLILYLDKIWYAQYDRSPFHYFDDSGEWLQMDKGGHVSVAYTYTKWAYGAMIWAGVGNNKAAWTGMAAGTILQGTLEVLDGFSTVWGFSWSDIAANTSGCALFGVQQAVWNEQRMTLKLSNMPRSYSNAPIRSSDGLKTSSIRQRTDDLYGNNFSQTSIKDYNALTYWLSINPKSFNEKSRFPAWLNIAVGYGADNLFGGYNNEWPTDKPQFFLSKTDLPRYRQFYLSLDIDLSRIKTKSKLLNTVLRTINFIKIPSPTVEFNSLNQIKFHPFFF